MAFNSRAASKPFGFCISFVADSVELQHQGEGLIVLTRTLRVSQAQVFVHQREIKTGAFGVFNRVCQVLHGCED